MFRVGNLKIRFEQQKLSCYEKTGRHGIECSVYQDKINDPIITGIVLLSRGDQPNKITGKKYALRKALIKNKTKRKSDEKEIITWWMSKEERTEIWKAFWEWVESWKYKPCNTCMFFDDEFSHCDCQESIDKNTVKPTDSCDYWKSKSICRACQKKPVANNDGLCVDCGVDYEKEN